MNATSASQSTSSMTAERLHEFFAAWESGDVDRVVPFFTNDAMYLASAGPSDDGTAFRGIDEVRRGVKAFIDMYPDGHYTDAIIRIDGDQGLALWTFHGTTVDGTEVQYRGVDVFEFAGNLIRVKDAFRKERARPIGG